MTINEFLVWLIQFSPLFSSALIVMLFYKKSSISSNISIAGIGFSWLLSLWLLFSSIIEKGHSFVMDQHLWISVFNFDIEFGIMTDGLTAIMVFVVTSVALIVQIFSKGYMEHDSSIPRYYTFLSIFIFSMLGAVLASNLLQIFIFWELMGLCSFLLIGFWFEKPSAVKAARKAFLVTRFGDLGFILSIVLIWNSIGSLDIMVINSKVTSMDTNVLLFAAFGLLCGAMGKSAQFPLHVWLPDAMEGPTPVSALIHAATMVAAGVFLVARFFPLFESVDMIQTIMIVIGITTLILTGFLGIAANDIKRVLAYSTVSQLGYMFVALGLGAYIAAIFHLITHAFFKALLFLCAGSINHSTDTFDMRNMGGLSKLMPLTFTTFLIGSLSLCGLFPFAGFWSKELIIGAAYEKNIIVFVCLMVGVFLTSFYVFRALIMTFFGDFHPTSEFSKLKKHVHESSRVMSYPLLVLAIPALFLGFIDFFHIFEEMLYNANPYLNSDHGEHHFHLFIPVISIGLITLGAIFSYLIFYKNYLKLFRNNLNSSFLVKLLNERYYIDYFIEKVFVTRFILGSLGNSLVFFDKKVIDRAVNFTGKFSINIGQIFVRSVNGQIQFYSFAIIGGLLVCQIILLLVSFYVLGT